MDILETVLGLICIALTLIYDVLVILVVLSFFSHSFLIGICLLILIGSPLLYVSYRFNQAVYNQVL